MGYEPGRTNGTNGRSGVGAGEDPSLGSEMVRAYVRGYQGYIARRSEFSGCLEERVRAFKTYLHL